MTIHTAMPAGFDFEALHRLTPDQRLERMREINDELTPLGKHENLTRSQEERFNELNFEFRALTRIGELAEIREQARGGNVVTPRSAMSGTDDDRDRDVWGDAITTRARRNIDAANRSGTLPSDAAENAERLVTTGPHGERSAAARWAAVAGDPAYLRAFAHMVADPTRGHLMWTEEEREAFAAVQRYQSEERAMSLTTTEGGALVPLTLDPAIHLSNAGAINPLPQIARVVTTATDSWTGINSSGATAEWLAEEAEAADGAPTVDDEPIPVHKGSCFVPFSYEVGMDAVNFTSEITRVMVDSIAVQEAVAFTTGSGSDQPTGFVTALTGTASEVNAAADDTFAAGDVYALQNALPARFSGNASWLSSLPVMNLIRQFETTGGALKFPELANGQLLGRPIRENSTMDSTVTTTGAVSNFILAYGEWKEFVIVRRIGTQVELVPHLFGASRRPTGQRGFHAWYRTGSDVLVNNALRMLDVASAA